MAVLDELLQPEDIRVLADLGFMAISRGLDTEADAIFDGVVAVRPDNEAGHIGRALMRLFRNQAYEAVAILKKLPPTDAAQLFLGMSLVRNGDRTEARAVLTDLVSTAAGTPPAETAQMILNEI